MIKGLRLAFVEVLRCFGRRVQEFFRNAGIYTSEQSQINKTTPNKIPKNYQINTKSKTRNLEEFRNLNRSNRSSNEEDMASESLKIKKIKILVIPRQPKPGGFSPRGLSDWYWEFEGVNQTVLELRRVFWTLAKVQGV